MAAKRSATSELNHENWDQEDDDEPEAAGQFSSADQETLKSRVIKKARRRGTAPQTTGGPSVFSSFGGFGSSTASPQLSGGAAPASGAFDFLAKGPTNGLSAKAEDKKPALPTFTFGSSSTSNGGGSSVFGSAASDSTTKPTFSFGAKSDSGFFGKAAETSFSVFGGSTETTKKVPEEGSKDGGKKVVSDPHAALPLTGSLDAFKTKGLKWTCGSCMVPNDEAKDKCVCCEAAKPGTQAKKADPFAATAKSGSKWTCGTCMVQNDPEKDSCPCCEAPKPGSSSLSPPKKAAAFSVAPGGGFKFGGASNAAATTTTGSFKFGATSGVTTSSSAPAPALFGGSGFKLGPSKPESTDPSAVTSGKKSDEYLVHLKALNEQFSKWISRNVDKDPCVLLTPCIKDYERHLSDLNKKFGSDPAAGKDAPPAEKPKPPAPPLLGAVFGNPSKAPPTFAVGDTSSKQPLPGGFSFGTPSGFGSAGQSMFGAAAISAKKDALEDSGKKEEDVEEEDQPPKVEVNRVNEEESVHSVKCKLFYKKGKEFVDKGLGMLHLKKVEGGKVQLLVRAETNLGNILLNILLSKQMNLTKRSNNVQFVCVPNPPIPGVEPGPLTMLVKVKSGDLAMTLEEKIKELTPQ